MPLRADHVLILDGGGLFHPDLLPYLDYRLWIDIPLAEAARPSIAREAALGRDVRHRRDHWAGFEGRFHPRAAADTIVERLPHRK